MEFVETLATTFAIAFAATLIVPLIAKLGGAKRIWRAWRAMFGVAVGITIAKALQLQFGIPSNMFAIVLGVCPGVCVWIAYAIGGSAKREA